MNPKILDVSQHPAVHPAPTAVAFKSNHPRPIHVVVMGEWYQKESFSFRHRSRVIEVSPMEWIDNMLMLAGRPVASIRLSGERWLAFEHNPTGARIIDGYNVRQDARDAAERAARARLALCVGF